MSFLLAFLIAAGALGTATPREDEALRDAMRAQPTPSPFTRPPPRVYPEGVPPQGLLAGQEDREGLTATQWVWLSALAATVVLLFVEVGRRLGPR